jgi:valyl-tRNA synthetase
MIIAGYEYMDTFPFRNVYYTGIVRDSLGRKMSKSLGNSPDPLDLIAKYGADGVRVGMLLSSPAGNDLLFDSALCEQGRNFSNKVWNAFRLVSSWRIDDIEQPAGNKVSIEWFRSRFNQALEEINDHYEKFRISDALMSMYKLVWDDFCSWYLEMIKPGFEAPMDRATYEATVGFFEDLLKLMHPFMPFISEEIWQYLHTRSKEDALIIAQWPKVGAVDSALMERFAFAMDVITQVRTIRNEKNIAHKVKLQLHVLARDNNDRSFDEVICKLCNISQLDYITEKITNAYTFVVKSNEYFIPFNENIDVKGEMESLRQELEYTKGFLNSVVKKLSNERFVAGAPENVVAMEKKKQADAEAKIRVLEEKIASLN